MKKIKTKISLSIAVDKKLGEYLTDNFDNKSKYIEYLIYQDLLINGIVQKNKFINYD